MPSLRYHADRYLMLRARARVVDDPAAFARRELRGRAVTGVYGLRDAPAVKIALRHTTHDLYGFDQVFRQASLAVPDAVRERVGASPHIVDLGANIGMTAAWLLRDFPGARLTAVEADPTNAAVLRAAGNPVELVVKAASNAPGTLRFVTGGHGTSHAARGGETDGVIEVETFDALPLLQDADLVKIDIEGGEWPILTDARLADVRAPIALEYHPAGAPSADPREAAHAALTVAGYTVHDVPFDAPTGEGALWAWRA